MAEQSPQTAAPQPELVLEGQGSAAGVWLAYSGAFIGGCVVIVVLTIFLMLPSKGEPGVSGGIIGGLMAPVIMGIFAVGKHVKHPMRLRFALRGLVVEEFYDRFVIPYDRIGGVSIAGLKKGSSAGGALSINDSAGNSLVTLPPSFRNPMEVMPFLQAWLAGSAPPPPLFSRYEVPAGGPPSLPAGWTGFAGFCLLFGSLGALKNLIIVGFNAFQIANLGSSNRIVTTSSPFEMICLVTAGIAALAGHLAAAVAGIQLIRQRPGSRTKLLTAATLYLVSGVIFLVIAASTFWTVDMTGLEESQRRMTFGPAFGATLIRLLLLAVPIWMFSLLRKPGARRVLDNPACEAVL